jgi:predicted nuclease with TOPRIM domain
MSGLRTLKDIEHTIHLTNIITELREAAKEWRDALKEALVNAAKTQEDGYLNNVKLEIEGVIYEASAFEDDEARPIIKFINQFFNLEGENK